MTTWKIFNESKPLFSDLYLVKYKDGCFLGEYGVCYYSQEHKSFGEFISFYDSERDEDDEAFVSCESIVAWAPFQRIDEEHKEKAAEQMFNDLDYKKSIKDGCIDFKRHTENVDEGLIEFDLDTKTVCASWFLEQKEITIAELKAINQQCKELGVDLMKTKEEYIDDLDQMEESYYNFDNCISAMNKFKECVNSLTGLVNEHFEEKSETNLEFYYDDLLEEGFSDFAVVNGKIKSCLYVPCDKCEFKKKNCSKDRIAWLLSQRKKPKYKFTQFEYDLINTYSHVDDRCKFNGCYQLKKFERKRIFQKCG